ncbi:YtxH domain-containing protein [Halolactibacillus sp. JCM 19043]|uniref:YtxH domain-containing protein n=1 Tax=Halolactibacillus sp. JCM 19043 TaxID=1460638 RepID=UPI000A9187C3|nr:YtxH domain-containing protein [Halolactibacillus sp. JCM 19043]
MKAKSLALGLVVGSAVGAGVTLLNAPRSGKDTREHFKSQANEVKEAIEKAKVNGKLLSDQIIATSKEGAELIKDLSKDMKGRLSSGNKRLSHIKTISNITLKKLKHAYKNSNKKHNSLNIIQPNLTIVIIIIAIVFLIRTQTRYAHIKM